MKFIACFAGAILTLVAGFARAETASVGSLTIETASQVHAFRIEIADEPAERSRGLMFRDSLAEDAGMLFIYPSPRIASFWMKNTEISLDMLFIDAQGMIDSIARETTPFSLKPVKSDGEVLSVFEISGGQADALGIAVGDTVEWSETTLKK